MAGIEQVVTVRYVRELVEEQEKTHREVSDILRQEHPGVQGLSERSVRRYCATNGIRRHDSHLTRGAVDEVVASAAAEVRVHVFSIFSFGFVSYTISFLVVNVLRFATSCELVVLFTCVASLEASHNARR